MQDSVIGPTAVYDPCSTFPNIGNGVCDRWNRRPPCDGRRRRRPPAQQPQAALVLDVRHGITTWVMLGGFTGIRCQRGFFQPMTRPRRVERVGARCSGIRFGFHFSERRAECSATIERLSEDRFLLTYRSERRILAGRPSQLGRYEKGDARRRCQRTVSLLVLDPRLS